MEKLLTIAIPTYNRSKFLDMLLYSIYNQYDSRLEVIVSDNASTDNTEGIVKKFENLVYIRNTENIGPDANFLQCYEKANGKYIWLIGSDDLVFPGAISYILNFLENNNNITHLFLNHNFFKDDEINTQNHNNYLKLNDDLILNSKNKWLSIIKNQITFMSAMIISKNVYNAVENPIKYNDTWFMHTCIILESSNFGNQYGIIKNCCLSDNITVENSNQDKKETWIFKVFGQKLHYVYLDLALKHNFNKKEINKLYSSFVCGRFGRAIIRMKANNIDYKSEFYKYVFPYIKKYIKTWLFTIPCILIPKFICRFIYAYLKPLYKKIIKR